MPQVCLYFQLHQPYRLAEFSVFDVGLGAAAGKTYFDDAQHHNQSIFQKVADKSYRPMLQLLLELVNQLPDFRCTFSASGVFLEQAQAWAPDVIELLRQLVATGQVELLAETYYHSLAALYSETEFAAQVQLHTDLLQQLFGYQPIIFRNTELIYSNHIAELVQELGFQGMLTEAVDRHLGGRPRTQPFVSHREDGQPGLPLLLKHAPLSDDIAFRFSDRGWLFHPLHAHTYLEWLHHYGPNEIINLFMDFETFGEHQWADTGIFDFFRQVILELHQQPETRFVTPRQVLVPLAERGTQSGVATPSLTHLPVYDVPQPISWADVDRDLSAWRDNALQWDTLRAIYELETRVLAASDPRLLQDWRRLQTSDHFYYMCIKWSADGDVHAYFSPYADPHQAYTRYAAVLADLGGRV